MSSWDNRANRFNFGRFLTHLADMLMYCFESLLPMAHYYILTAGCALAVYGVCSDPNCFSLPVSADDEDDSVVPMGTQV